MEKKRVPKIIIAAATAISLLNICLAVMSYNSAKWAAKIDMNYEKESGGSAEIEGALMKLGYPNVAATSVNGEFSGVADIKGIGNVFLVTRTIAPVGKPSLADGKVEFRKIVLKDQQANIEFYVEEERADLLLDILKKNIK